MIDLSALPCKLGEPKRLANLGFGIGALMFGTAINIEWMKLLFYGLGVIGLSMTLFGFINPVTVHSGFHPGKSQYKAIPAWFGKYVSTGNRSVSTPYEAKKWVEYGSHDGVSVGRGRTLPVYNTAYGAEVIIPAGPATNAQAAVQYLAEPTFLRYVTGVENEGKIIGQGG